MTPAENTVSVVYEKGILYELSLSNLQPDFNQPRKVIDAAALEELTDSIAKHGVLEPILFRTDEAGVPTIVAGERRVEAARKAGLTTIPAIYVAGKHAEIALVENLLRQDLTVVEEAEALQRLMEEQQYTQEQLSVIIGKARSTITEILTVNRLPAAIRDDCRGNRSVPRSVLLEIARKKQERAMHTAYNAYKEKLGKVKQPRQKTDPNAPQVFLDLIDKTARRISDVDITGWNEEDSMSFIKALTELKNRIDSILHPVPT